MISTKGAARFHSNQGFNFNIPASQAGTMPPQVIGGNPSAMAPNPAHGMKRQLASCREELEQSWRGIATSSNVNQDYHHCISNSESSDADNVGYGGPVKRRRTGWTSSSSEAADDEMMDDGSNSNISRGIRICQSNRPPNRQPSKAPIKAGWYEGDLNAFGNRHGRGTTKHDDCTEYEGAYVEDIMSGPGTYKFLPTQHMVPNPLQNGSHLHRQITKIFKGTFTEDVPHGPGMMITKTVDCAPQVLGSTPRDVRFTQVVYDMGMYQNHAVGEGVRVIYSNTTNGNGSSSLEKMCFRLNNGESTNLKVNAGYAEWMVGCMGLEFPTPSVAIWGA